MEAPTQVTGNQPFHAPDKRITGRFTSEVSSNFVEMGTAIRSGILWEDYDAKKTIPTGKTKLEDFAKEFAVAYNN